MSSPHWVFDAGAVLAYVHGVDIVGEIVADTADAEGTVSVPLVSLLQAYSALHHTEHEHLRVLRRNPFVRTEAPSFDVERADDCPTIGGMAQRTRRLGAANAAYVARVYAAGVVTSHPDQIRSVLGDRWPVVEV